MFLEEKDKRIEDLRREAKTLRIFAHYFKSIEYRRLEASTEERKIVKPGVRRKASDVDERATHTAGRDRTGARKEASQQDDNRP